MEYLKDLLGQPEDEGDLEEEDELTCFCLGRGGKEPVSGRCYGPHPVLRDRKLLGKPSQARKGSIGGQVRAEVGSAEWVGAEGRETAEG